jgi:hypothetical protein
MDGHDGKEVPWDIRHDLFVYVDALARDSFEDRTDRFVDGAPIMQTLVMQNASTVG